MTAHARLVFRNFESRFVSVALMMGAVLLLLQGCASSTTHPSLVNQSLPKMVPVRDLVANASYAGNYRLSPDGRKMAFEGVSGLRSALLWRYVDGETNKVVRKFRKNAPSPFWSSNSQHILYNFDGSGRENYHVYAFDTDNPDAPAKNLTPFENTRAFVSHVPREPSDLIYVVHNRRDSSIFDLYEINIRTGAEKLVYKNTDNVIHMMQDDNGEMRVRTLQNESNRIIQVLEAGQWRELLTVGLFDVVNPIGFTENELGLYVLSNLNRDKLTFVEIDLATSAEKEIYSHPLVDIDGVFLSQDGARPLFVNIAPDYPDIHFLDDEFAKKLKPFFEYGRNGVDILSIDREATLATLETFDTTGGSFILANLKTGESTVLGETPVRQNKEVWVDSEPFTLPASDGLQLHGYLTLPKVDNPKNLPTVLLVHGGPWARDYWNFDSWSQFLANRGYAVVQLNYRGSSGYGRNYMFAAEGEFAGQQHQDLIDAIDWAIDKGISDPDKIAIMGASFGGYATLLGMTITADRFACGVDFVGPSDLASLLENVPPYWKNGEHFWHRFAGDPSDPEMRKVLDEKSPINHVEKAQNPILIVQTTNDVRVQRDQADLMVAALRKAGKPVEYTLIKGEGHGLGHWKNRLKFYRQVEDFFHDCLGGRSGGLDYYQLGSWAF